MITLSQKYHIITSFFLQNPQEHDSIPMSTFADLIPEDVWSSVDTARTAAGVVANHTSAVVKAFSEVE